MTLQERARLATEVRRERAYAAYLEMRRYLSDGYSLKEAAFRAGYSLDGATKLVRRYRPRGRRF